MATPKMAAAPKPVPAHNSPQDWLTRVELGLDGGDQVGEIQTRLRAWLAEEGPGAPRTLTAVAKAIGLSPPVLSQFASGQYPGNNEHVARRLAEFFANEERRALHPPDPSYRENRFTKTVWRGLRHAHDSQDVAVIYGDPGKGKTVTIRKYVLEHPTAILLTANPTIRSDRAVLEELCAILRQRAKGDSSRTFFTALVVALKGSRRLLILDEAQHLTTPAVNVLRALHDEAGIGLVLCGNEEVWQRMETKGGVVRAPFAQLRDRVGYRRHLKGSFVRDEVRDVAIQILPGLDRQGVDYLHLQAERTGSLRIVQKHCVWVAKKVNGTGRSPTLEDLQQATGVVA